MQIIHRDGLMITKKAAEEQLDHAGRMLFSVMRGFPK